MLHHFTEELALFVLTVDAELSELAGEPVEMAGMLLTVAAKAHMERQKGGGSPAKRNSGAPAAGGGWGDGIHTKVTSHPRGILLVGCATTHIHRHDAHTSPHAASACRDILIAQVCPARQKMSRLELPRFGHNNS